MQYTLQHIADALGFEAVINLDDEPVNFLLTDSRRISFPASSLFFALQTERRDAHIFIKELYERGVKNFVVKKDFDISSYTHANFLFTENTLDALQRLAAYHRSQFNYPVIAITGSNGKTVVKEWLYQLLSPDYNIVRSPRSYNSQTGVALSLWQMNETDNLAIFEAGISQAGEMEKLEKMIQPTIGLFTNIGEAHNDGFKNLEEKIKEKLQLFKNANFLICNSDDTLILNELQHFKGEILNWSIQNKASLTITSVKKSEAST
ncbi:MAG: Mur ligase family protein, partial [Parafilimonas sp.]